MNKILLVEDDRSMQSLIKTLLEIEGYTVTVCDPLNEDVIEKSLHDTLPDILLMDVFLRRLNGIDLLKKLRINDQYRSVKIVMTSGMNVEEECRASGAQAFLLKPYMPEELIQILKHN